jgi:squalene synthase HpnC
MVQGSDNPIAALERYGPGSGGRVSLVDARAYVRRLTLGHYENFSVLSRLVPRALQEDFAGVYAFCRWSDDLGDEIGGGEADRARSQELLRWWRGELEGCIAYAQGGGEEPGHPVMRVLAETLRQYPLDSRALHNLIDAFEQDQRVTRYETWDQLLDYCSKSADPVGRLVLGLGGIDVRMERWAELVEMSDATCTALQLTNFCQDVRRDLVDRDRVYLPSAETGFEGEQLRDWMDRGEDSEVRVRYIRAVRGLTERTRELFELGRGLPEALRGTPAEGVRRAVWLFGAGGERVLSKIERGGCTTLWRRPTLGGAGKARLVLRALLMR